MGSFGDGLRIERERLGVSLEEISASTKVTMRHLRALEEEDFGNLPGGVFNKGILRDYVRQLGLDELAWLESFASAYAQSGAMKDGDANWQAFSDSMGDPRLAARPVTRLKWAGVALLGTFTLILGLVLWSFVRHH